MKYKIRSARSFSFSTEYRQAKHQTQSNTAFTCMESTCTEYLSFRLTIVRKLGYV